MSINENISILLSELKKFSVKTIIFFDIETKQLFKDIVPEWEDLTSSERNQLYPMILKEIEMAIAGVLTFDIKEDIPKFDYYTETDIEQLKKKLGEYDIIIGYNLLRFDYLVVEKYLTADFIKKLKGKTIDTFVLLYNRTEEYISLNDLGKLNLGMIKTEDTLMIPKLWKEGRYSEVKEYLRRDLELTAGIFCYVLKFGQLLYPHKTFGKFIEDRTVKLDWTSLLR